MKCRVLDMKKLRQQVCTVDNFISVIVLCSQSLTSSFILSCHHVHSESPWHGPLPHLQTLPQSPPSSSLPLLPSLNRVFESGRFTTRWMRLLS